MIEPRRIAILVELPIGLENAGIASLRRFLKTLIRSYGIRCLSVLPPNETRTFGNYIGSKAKIKPAASIGVQAAASKPDDEHTLDAKPAWLAKSRKRKRRTLSKGSPT